VPFPEMRPDKGASRTLSRTDPAASIFRRSSWRFQAPRRSRRNPNEDYSTTAAAAANQDSHSVERSQRRLLTNIVMQFGLPGGPAESKQPTVDNQSTRGGYVSRKTINLSWSTNANGSTDGWAWSGEPMVGGRRAGTVSLATLAM